MKFYTMLVMIPSWTVTVLFSLEWNTPLAPLPADRDPLEDVVGASRLMLPPFIVTDPPLSMIAEPLRVIVGELRVIELLAFSDKLP